jgi:hypothetical protein
VWIFRSKSAIMIENKKVQIHFCVLLHLCTFVVCIRILAGFYLVAPDFHPSLQLVEATRIELLRNVQFNLYRVSDFRKGASTLTTRFLLIPHVCYPGSIFGLILRKGVLASDPRSKRASKRGNDIGNNVLNCRRSRLMGLGTFSLPTS